MVKILRDDPSGVDGFNTEVALDERPHARIAKAIERRIMSPEGGGTIGLEGDYGSGKSTIVRILRERLAKQSNVHFVVFDAWAHEGDPLRRAFLETLINHLMISGDALLKAKWLEEKERLAKRHRISTENKKSSPSRFGIMVVLATSLVPIGLLISRVSADGTTFNLDRNLPVAWSMVIGVLLTLAPLFVVLLRLIGLFFELAIRKTPKELPIIFGKYLNGIWVIFRKCTYKVRKYAPTTILECFMPQRFNFLAHHGIMEIESNSLESIDPTSIEFEAKYHELINDVINESETRIVLVVDNLDRLSALKILDVWSNLQTFVSNAALKKEAWSTQLSLLVPYTPSAINALWQDAHAVSNPESFFEKTFQIRYSTPPPTLTDWQSYLRSLLDAAVPEITFNDQSKIIEVCDLVRRENKKRAVPRQLKLFVNQLAILWEMWNNESAEPKIPASHLAYSCLNSAPRKRYEECLRDRYFNSVLEGDLVAVDFPSHEAIHLCGDKLVDNLAAVYFNVNPQHAIQLLIEDQIETALTEGASDKLFEFMKNHGNAFWAILLSKVRKLAKTTPEHILAKWCIGLHGFRGYNVSEFLEIKRYMRQRFKDLRTAWKPLDPETIKGICEWPAADDTPDLKDYLVYIIDKTLRSKSKELDISSRIDLATQAHYNGLSPESKLWSVHMSELEWLDTASHVCEDKSHVVFINPTCTSDALIHELCKRATHDENNGIIISNQDIDSIRIIRGIRPNFSPSLIISKLTETLITTASDTKENYIDVVAKCIRLLHRLRLLGFPEVDDALRSDDSTEAVLTILPFSKEGSKERAVLTASLLHSHPALDFKEAFSDTDESIKSSLEDLRKTGDLTQSRLIWEQLKEFKCLKIIRDLSGNKAGGLIVDFVEHAAKDGNVSMVLHGPFVHANAEWLRNKLSTRETAVETVVNQLSEDGDSVKYLKNKSILDLKTHDALRLFIDFGSENLQNVLLKWTIEQLTKIDKEDWAASLETNLSLLDITLYTTKQVDKQFLSAAFKNALIIILPKLLKNEIEIAESRANEIGKLVSILPSHVRKDLGSKSIAIIKDKNNGFNEVIATIFGDAILCSDAQFDSEEFALFVARSLPQGKNYSAKWYLQWVSNHPIESEEISEDTYNLLNAELSAAINESKDEYLLINLKELAGIFGIDCKFENQETNEDSPDADTDNIE